MKKILDYITEANTSVPKHVVVFPTQRTTADKLYDMFDRGRLNIVDTCMQGNNTLYIFTKNVAKNVMSSYASRTYNAYAVPSEYDNNITKFALALEDHDIELDSLEKVNLSKVVSESAADDVARGTWDYMVRDDYKVYDAFVDRLKNYYAKDDDKKAYKIEDEIHSCLIKMMNELDKKYKK